MDQAIIANAVNKLVDLLMDEGVTAREIRDELDLGYYEMSFLGLGWLEDDDE